MTGMIKDKLNGRLGAEVIKEIVLKAGRVDLPLPEATEDLPTPLPLTPHQKALIEEQAAHIEDPETRQAFAEMMQASLSG